MAFTQQQSVTVSRTRVLEAQIRLGKRWEAWVGGTCQFLACLAQHHIAKAMRELQLYTLVSRQNAEYHFQELLKNANSCYLNAVLRTAECSR